MSIPVKFTDLIKTCTGVEDFYGWVQKLELVANLQGIKELQTLLPLFLSCGAFAVYQGLNEEVKKNYSFVKAAQMKGDGNTAAAPNRVC